MRTGNNIRQRSDGRFEARYPKGRDEKGRIIYGCCYGRTYEEAAQKRAEIVQKPVREMNLLILGAGSHGQEIRELAQRLNVFRKIDFLDDDLTKEVAIGRCMDAAQFIEDYPVAVPAVGNHDLRMKWMELLRKSGFILPVLIHPDAVVSSSATIGYGTVVCASATISSGAKIGYGCIISSGVTVARDAAVPDGVHVECGRVVTAETRFEEEV